MQQAAEVTVLRQKPLQRISAPDGASGRMPAARPKARAILYAARLGCQRNAHPVAFISVRHFDAATGA